MLLWLPGNIEIIKLLLIERAVLRNQTNAQGLTAYEEAKTEEIRQLFRRPASNSRFSLGEKDGNDFISFCLPHTDPSGDSQRPSTYVVGYPSRPDAIAARPIDIERARRTGRTLLTFCAPWNLIEAGSLKDDLHPFKIERNIQEFIQKHVPGSHREYEKCRQLLIHYRETKNIEHLLKIYTLDTPFYKKLPENPPLLSNPIKNVLSSLDKRFYQGISYRGLLMSFEAFQVYGWAFENKDSFLKTTTFASTSTDKAVAEMYSGESGTYEYSVLMVFNFFHASNVAIKLSKIPEFNLACLSNFEDENEVLILPDAFFKVLRIEYQNNTKKLMIYLENFIPE